MNQMNENNAPYIKRTINGQVFTVLIRFNPDAKETAKDKMKRVLKAQAAKMLVEE